LKASATRRFAILPRRGKAKGLPGNVVERLRNMLAYISAAGSVEELKVPPNYGAHELTGDRKGTWSLTVTKNWRMTFWVNAQGNIEDLDLEDYH
jgi:toxin HigB-1